MIFFDNALNEYYVLNAHMEIVHKEIECRCSLMSKGSRNINNNKKRTNSVNVTKGWVVTPVTSFWGKRGDKEFFVTTSFGWVFSQTIPYFTKLKVKYATINIFLVDAWRLIILNWVSPSTLLSIGNTNVQQKYV